MKILLFMASISLTTFLFADGIDYLVRGLISPRDTEHFLLFITTIMYMKMVLKHDNYLSSSIEISDKYPGFAIEWIDKSGQWHKRDCDLDVYLSEYRHKQKEREREKEKEKEKGTFKDYVLNYIIVTPKRNFFLHHKIKG